MATLTSAQRKASSPRAPGRKPGRDRKVENSGFSFQDYVLKALTQIQTDIREFRSETKTDIRELRSETKTDFRELRANVVRLDGRIDGLQRWGVIVAITLFLGLLSLMTFFYNKLDNKIDKRVDKLEIKIDKNSEAIRNIDKKLDQVIDRLPEK